MRTRRETPAKLLLQRLSKINVIRALPPEEIYNLKNFVTPVDFSKGEVIIREGAEGDSLFFIDEGTVLVSRSETGNISELSEGETFGEAALLTGEIRNATCTAKTDVSGWMLRKADFDAVVGGSSELKKALEELSRKRKQGIVPDLPSSQSWTATALRSIAARHRGLTPWQALMGIGLAGWALLTANELAGLLPVAGSGFLFAIVQLAPGCWSFRAPARHSFRAWSGWAPG